MALARDAVGPNSSGSSVANVSSDSWSHTMGAGANGLLMACLNYANTLSTTPDTVTALTFNGVSMLGSGATARQTKAYSNAAFGLVSEFYYLVAPASGTHTVAITWSGGGVYATDGTVSYTGANQSSPIGNTNTASGSAVNNGSPTVSSSIGNMVLDTLHRPFGAGVPTDSPSGNQTSVFNGPYFTGYYGAAQDAAGASSVTMTWTWTNSSDFCWSGVEIVAAGGGGNVVSGGVTEGADAAGGGSIKVAIKASGGVTEGKDATSGTIKLASKVSGGATEGPDATAGSVKVALKVSGGVTEGADFTTGALSVGSTHVSGNLTEGADATGGGSVKVALHVSGALTEGKDATAGNLLVAVKVSGGVTEGADAISGSITATSRTISGGFTEGADRTSGIIISGTVSQGGHFLPLTKKEIAEARKRAKAARDKEEAGWDQAAKDKAELHQQILKTLHPEKILGIGRVEKPEEDDDEADIEMLLLYG